MNPPRTLRAILLSLAVALLPMGLPGQSPGPDPWGGWHDDGAADSGRVAAGTASAAVGTAGAAASSAADLDGRIEGFMGLRWHADSASIVAEMGEPIAVSKRRSGFIVFSYTPMFLQRDGFLNLWVDPEMGLLRASYEAVTDECTDYMRTIVAELRHRHPRVPSEIRGNVDLNRLDKSLCTAVLDDGATLTMVWTDRQGNRLRVGAGPKDPALRMVGTTDEFRKRLRRSP